MKKNDTQTVSCYGYSVGKLFNFLSLRMVIIGLLLTGSAAFGQTINITGTVKDGGGGAIPGVGVRVKNAKVSTQTDVNGKYSIKVPDANSTLVFSYIGLVSQEVVVGSRKVIDITLKEDESALDEVVVTGYGEKVKKRDLTGSISSVTAKDIAERQPLTLFDALQGQASGVLVTNDNGDPAGQGTIQIRGASSINATGTGPLYVIDGIISENGNYVNPSDIESFEILKDVASAAIYGARGANGVIIITTKRGKEGKPLIGVQYTYNRGELANKIRTISADELRFYRMIRGGGAGIGGNVDSINPYLNADNDYQELLFRTSQKHTVNLSLSGGSKGITYYGGLNYVDNQAIALNSWIKRIQSKLNIEYAISDKLTISNNLAFAYQTGNILNIQNTARQIFERNPWTSLYRPDGTLAGYTESKRNPVAFALLDKNIDNDYLAQFNTQAKYKIYKDLSITTMFNAQLDNQNSRNVTPAIINNAAFSTGTGSTERKVYWESQTYMNYNKTFGKDHTVTGVAGFTADRRRRDEYRIRVEELLSDDIFTSNVGIIDPTNTGTFATANSNVSLLARGSYSYKGRYIVQGTIRRDGSSRFGENSKWGNFISMSAAWRFSDEKFMDWSKSFLDDAKLRYSYGSAGNDAIGDYQSYTTINFGGNYYNGLSGAAENVVLGNSLIQWETATSANYGIDLTMIKGRLTFTAEYYNKTTKDLLYQSELAKETGKTQVAVNLGTIENTGIEFTVVGTPIKTEKFGWDVNANVTFPKARVKKLADGTAFLSGNKWLIQEGGKIGDFFIFKNLGVYQYDVSNAYTPEGRRLTPVDVVVSEDGNTVTSFGGYTLDGQPYTGTVKSKYYNNVKLQGGDTEWLDANNDGNIDDNDKIIAGNGLPTYYFGLSNTFRYKRFSLSFLFNGQFGNKIYNRVAADQNRFNSTYSPPTSDAALTSWYKQGDITKYPLASRKDTRGNMRFEQNSLYLEDGAFIRLSSARLAFTLDPKIAAKAKMKSATVYLFGQNLLTWTNYSLFDPEFSTSNQLQPGNDSGRYPKIREFGLGVNLTF